MAARLEVLKDVSNQVIWFYPQEGRPSATPTVAIKDKYGSTLTAAADTNVTQGTVNTTSNGATTINATTMTLDSITGIEVGKTYLITNAALQREWVRVYGVDTSNKIVTFDEQLEFAHADEATFQDVGFYYTLQDSEVNTLDDMRRARATYTWNSISYVEEINFDVVLTSLKNPLTVEFIKKRHPNITQREASTTLGSDFADFREVAWDNVMKGIRSHKEGWRPALLKTPENIEQWAIAEFDLIAHKEGTRILRGDWDPQAAIEHLEGRVMAESRKAMDSLEFMDFNDDDGQSSDEIEYVRPDFVR
jgi:hypothetical protein